MLENFGKHWETVKDDIDAAHRLMSLILERVYVQDQQVVALTLKADYHIVLGTNIDGSTEITLDPSVYRVGDDGGQLLACIHLIPPYYQKNHVMFSHIVTRVLGKIDRIVPYDRNRHLPRAVA